MNALLTAALAALLASAGLLPPPDPLWVARYHHGETDGDAELGLRRCVASDPDGNVYVAGTVTLDDNIDGYHLLLVKYARDGGILWARTGYAHDAGGPVNLAVDGAGRPYVSATSAGAALLVLAYEADGSLRWSVRPPLPAGATSAGEGVLAVGPDGRVVATATLQMSGGSDYDLVTYAVDPSGQVAWSARYDGPVVGGSVWARVLAIGPDGEVLIGGSARSGTWQDYLVLKYDAFGQEAWVALYDGPPGGQDDSLVDLAVDDSGAVYVTGKSAPAVTRSGWATLKYDHAGNLLWLTRYDETRRGGGHSWPTGLALGPDGSVFVTGSTAPPGELRRALTVKYTATGSLAWSRPWTGNSSDAGATDVVGDGQGGVYVAARAGWAGDLAALRYDADGQLVWQDVQSASRVAESGPSLDLDGKGRLHLVAGVPGDASNPASTDDWWLLTWDEAGQLAWGATEPAVAATSERLLGPRTWGIDSQGDVYVAAMLRRTNRQDDILVVRFTAGQPAWARVYDHGSTDWPFALAIDDQGNVLVTGRSQEPGQGSDIVTLKYGPKGEFLWETRVANGGAGSSVAVDGSGNVYVTGSGATVKYDAQGTLLWSLARGGADLEPWADRLYVMDSVSGATRTTAYGVDGSLLWEAVSPDIGVHVDLVADATGRVVVTGWSQANGTGPDIATVAYDPDGAELWTSRYAGAGSADDRPAGLAVDGSGNVVVAGATLGAGGSLATLKYDADGVLLWSAGYGLRGGGSAAAVAIDPVGRAYVAANTPRGGQVFAYEPGGGLLWAALYAPPRGSSAAGLLIDGNGGVNLLATDVQAMASDLAVVRYPPPPWNALSAAAAGAAGPPAASGAPRSRPGRGAPRARSRAAAPAPAR